MYVKKPIDAINYHINQLSGEHAQVILPDMIGVISSMDICNETNKPAYVHLDPRTAEISDRHLFTTANLGLTIGSAAMRHEQLLQQSTKRSSPPELNTIAGGPYISAGGTGKDTIYAYGGFTELKVPSASLDCRKEAALAMAMAVRGLWASLVLMKYAGDIELCPEDVKHIAKLPGPNQRDKYATTKLDRGIRAGYTITTNTPSQMESLHEYIIDRL